MTEKAKRLEPKKKTLRELYLKSGNLCAFPNCGQIMMDVDGSFIGQICHIEAAEPGGQRFNPDMSNEERRSAANLMLMCYPHHVKTNDVDKYSVEKLKNLKKEHELKFSNPETVMLEKLRDITSTRSAIYPINLIRINAVLGFDLEDWQLTESLPEITDFIDKLQKVPAPIRQFCFEVAARFCRMRDTYAVQEELECIAVSALDIRDAFGISETTITEKCSQMGKYQLGGLHVEEYEENDATVFLHSLDSGWKIWSDIAQFCIQEDEDLSKIWQHLDFSILDE